MAFFRYLPLTLLLLSSCHYDEPAPKSRAELIAGNSDFGKTWQIVEIEVALGYLSPKQCIADNYFTYYPDGRYEVREGASKCNPTDPPAVVGTWSINQSETLLTIRMNGSSKIWDIEGVNEDHHKISSQFEEGLRTYTLHSSN